MPRIASLADLTVADLCHEVNSPEEVWELIEGQLLPAFQDILEEMLDGELVEQLHASLYQRNPERRDYRNGCYTRSLQTRLGLIPHLRVPRTRSGVYQSAILPAYRRYEGAVEGLIKDAFLAGVSTRRVGEVLQPILGATVSAQTVSHIAQSLDTAVQAFHRHPLTDAVRYLFLDGIVLKVKGVGQVHRRVILVAYAVRPTGERAVIAFRLASTESEAQWTVFLNDLYGRGLVGSKLRLVITDGSPGLHAALLMVYPDAPRQRCWAHKMRNVAEKLRQKDQETCLQELKTVYAADTEAEARRRYRGWAEHWQTTAPAAVACVAKDIDELVTFLKEPEALWRKLRTTNAIERIFREVRRRTRPMTCFTNAASCERIIYAVLNHQNDKWKEHPLTQCTQTS
jgi:putative transposase